MVVLVNMEEGTTILREHVNYTILKILILEFVKLMPRCNGALRMGVGHNLSYARGMFFVVTG